MTSYELNSNYRFYRIHTTFLLKPITGCGIKMNSQQREEKSIFNKMIHT